MSIAQKPQFRVQTLPSTMNVAVPSAQHSPWFGQRASSQTVCRDCDAHQAADLGVRLADADPDLQPLRPPPARAGVLGDRVAGEEGAGVEAGPPGYITSDGEWCPSVR